MSRASDLRDAIAAELRSRITNPVDVCVMPMYQREELADEARVAVMIYQRDLSAMQGPDERDVKIAVCVCGTTTPPEGFALDLESRLAKEVASSDGLDDLVEQLVALWTPDGELSRCGFAEHSFDEIEQGDVLDFNQYKEHGLWVSAFTVTYSDSLDEV